MHLTAARGCTTGQGNRCSRTATARNSWALLAFCHETFGFTVKFSYFVLPFWPRRWNRLIHLIIQMKCSWEEIEYSGTSETIARVVGVSVCVLALRRSICLVNNEPKLHNSPFSDVNLYRWVVIYTFLIESKRYTWPWVGDFRQLLLEPDKMSVTSFSFFLFVWFCISWIADLTVLWDV